MTIDEAIELYSNMAEYCKQFSGLQEMNLYHKQLTEWLEELKALKNLENSRFMIIGKTKKEFVKEIRNKAIDDFVKECEAEYDNDGCPGVSDYLDYKLSLREIFEIAEQLKVGGVE